MQDLLLFYYNATGTLVPPKFEEIVELCKLNSNLFDTAIIQEKELRTYEDEFISALSCAVVERERMGILLCGIALYFEEMGDKHNASRLFQLAIPSLNIIAIVYLNNIKLTDALLIDRYNEMKKKCKNMIEPFIAQHSCFTSLQKTLLDTILRQKLILNAAVKQERDTYAVYTEATNKMTKTLKDAIDLATCTFEFDIESFLNKEELDKLLA